MIQIYLSRASWYLEKTEEKEFLKIIEKLDLKEDFISFHPKFKVYDTTLYNWRYIGVRENKVCVRETSSSPVLYAVYEGLEKWLMTTLDAKELGEFKNIQSPLVRKIYPTL